MTALLSNHTPLHHRIYRGWLANKRAPWSSFWESKAIHLAFMWMLTVIRNKDDATKMSQSRHRCFGCGFSSLGGVFCQFRNNLFMIWATGILPFGTAWWCSLHPGFSFSMHQLTSHKASNLKSCHQETLEPKAAKFVMQLHICAIGMSKNAQTNDVAFLGVSHLSKNSDKCKLKCKINCNHCVKTKLVHFQTLKIPYSRKSSPKTARKQLLKWKLTFFANGFATVGMQKSVTFNCLTSFRCQLEPLIAVLQCVMPGKLFHLPNKKFVESDQCLTNIQMSNNSTMCQSIKSKNVMHWCTMKQSPASNHLIRWLLREKNLWLCSRQWIQWLWTEQSRWEQKVLWLGQNVVRDRSIRDSSKCHM